MLKWGDLTTRQWGAVCLTFILGLGSAAAFAVLHYCWAWQCILSTSLAGAACMWLAFLGAWHISTFKFSLTLARAIIRPTKLSPKLDPKLALAEKPALEAACV
jgi:hypothetical protein